MSIHAIVSPSCLMRSSRSLCPCAFPAAVRIRYASELGSRGQNRPLHLDDAATTLTLREVVVGVLDMLKPGGAMREWEYQILDLNDRSTRSTELDTLNRAGRAGWEMIALTLTGLAYMKRELARSDSKAEPAHPVPRESGTKADP